MRIEPSRKTNDIICKALSEGTDEEREFAAISAFSAEILKKLAKDKNPRVREAVANNLNTPRDVVKAIKQLEVSQEFSEPEENPV